MSRELTGIDWVQSTEKRRMDLMLACAAAPAAAITGAGALAMSRLIDGPGAIFRQERLGHEGERFEVVKIRTMKGEDASKPAKGEAEEITPLGKRLRPLGIDEIPQLLKVFDGTMSVVGPRAAWYGVFDKMEQALDRSTFEEWEDSYLSSKPGFISSYHIRERTGISNKEIGMDEQRMQLKASMDIHDFINASRYNDMKLLYTAAFVGASLLRRNDRFIGSISQAAQESLIEDVEAHGNIGSARD